MAQSLESNVEEAKEAKEQIEAEREELASQLAGMEEELNGLSQENEESAAVLGELESAGEDVGDARSIVEERKGQIEANQSRIAALLDRLHS